MKRFLFVVIILVLECLTLSAQQATITIDPIISGARTEDHNLIINKKNRNDIIKIPDRFQSEEYLIVHYSDQLIIIQLANGSLISYNDYKNIWNVLDSKLKENSQDKTYEYSSSTKSPASPFSNKVLLPIYFILGSILIYGLIRIILLKNEYDTKLDVEKLERGKLEEINQVKLNFYNMISHELKTPLTLIIGPIQELKEDVLSEKNSILIDYIEKNAIKLKTLIDEILDYKNHEFEYFDLNLELKSFSDFVQEICLNFKDNAARKSVKLNLNIELTQPYMHFDSKLMELAVNNLFVNALKFAPMNSEIHISVWEDVNGINFSISDNGPGILEKDLAHIFKKYYQGSNNASKGNGIGLALAKEIIEKHIGKIDVSITNSETTFSFHFASNLDNILPHYVDDNSMMMEQIEELNKENITAQSKTILIVDDNSDIRTYLKLRLQNSFNILVAGDGVEGLEKSMIHIPDIVISDIAMPQMDGITMCQQIKSNPITNHIPIILLTARTRDKYLQKSLANGADAYLTKPFDIHMLKQKIDNLLNHIDRIQKRVNSRISPSLSESSHNEFTNEFLEKFISTVKVNFENPLFSNEMIAELLNLSTSQIYRKIKSLTGHTPSKIIKNIKLEEAYKMLQETDYSISYILSKIGMSDPKYFRKIFKEKYGMTPSEARKNRNYS